MMDRGNDPGNDGGPDSIELTREDSHRWRIDRHGAMRLPGIVFASEVLLPSIHGDRALEQVCNVATLPGIVEASYAMPDIHWGYGFPIGGVAATDVAAGGVVEIGHGSESRDQAAGSCGHTAGEVGAPRFQDRVGRVRNRPMTSIRTMTRGGVQ